MKLRLRFIVRTLGAIVTMVCVYLGCWQLTSAFGVAAIERSLSGEVENNGRKVTCCAEGTSSPGPFLVVADRYVVEHEEPDAVGSSIEYGGMFLWCGTIFPFGESSAYVRNTTSLLKEGRPPPLPYLSNDAE